MPSASRYTRTDPSPPAITGLTLAGTPAARVYGRYLDGMTPEQAHVTLNAYAEACFTVETPKTSTDEAGIEAAYKIIDTLEPLVMRIINAYGMDGDPDDEDWGYAASGGMAQAAADLAEEHADLLRLDLGPCAPYIPADGLHASVWEAARPMWQAGATQDAVNAAARAVNARIQRKVGRRDVSDYELAMQVFDSQAPKPGKPRLRLPGDRSSQTWKSQQEGIKFFAAGCFRAIRTRVCMRASWTGRNSRHLNTSPPLACWPGGLT